MSLQYLIAALAANGCPPTGADLHRPNQGGFAFAPLCGNGSIYTIDPEIWKATAPSRGINYIFCPDESRLEQFISIHALHGEILLLGIIGQQEFQPIGEQMPGPLPLRPSIGSQYSLGYDVVDASGLSALVNIGFNTVELEQLRCFSFVTNESGLFSSQERAQDYAKFASEVAVEHSPFIPVEIIRASR